MTNLSTLRLGLFWFGLCVFVSVHIVRAIKIISILFRFRFTHTHTHSFIVLKCSYSTTSTRVSVHSFHFLIKHDHILAFSSCPAPLSLLRSHLSRSRKKKSKRGKVLHTLSIQQRIGELTTMCWDGWMSWTRLCCDCCERHELCTLASSADYLELLLLRFVYLFSFARQSSSSLTSARFAIIHQNEPIPMHNARAVNQHKQCVCTVYTPVDSLDTRMIWVERFSMLVARPSRNKFFISLASVSVRRIRRHHPKSRRQRQRCWLCSATWQKCW